ncbi:MAG TPA: DUF1499 domain-containing protein [Pelomicrobium sp.]|nr:DUF1499 domain-containing protein [Pelomicrobium sp.]
MPRSKNAIALAAVAAMAAAGSAGALGIDGGRLAPCPDSPNCVSSDATDPSHRIEPFRLAAAPEKAWAELQSVLGKMPRVTIAQRSADYLRAEFASAVFGFVDDVEFHLRAQDGVIAVRSASRTGYYDFGVNRRRVEDLRDALRQRGAVK